MTAKKYTREGIINYIKDKKLKTGDKLSPEIGGLLFLLKQKTVDMTGNPVTYSVEYLRPDCFRIFVNRRRR